MASHETLGLLLVRDGIITRPQLYDALRLQRQNNRLLGTCLLTLGHISPQALLEILARQLTIPALPAGVLSRASPDAIARVPADVAVRLRVVPYSWDGEILGVAVADGRALNHLHEVAFHSQSAVGAYVALELELEAVLRATYPEAARASMPEQGQAMTEVTLTGRPRPARAAQLGEVSPRDIGVALGIESGEHPVVLLEHPKHVPTAAAAAASTVAPTAVQAAVRRVIRSAPPPAPAKKPAAGAALELPLLELTRIGLYDAVEQIYTAKEVAEVGVCVGKAMLNYFARALVLASCDGGLRPVAFAGERPAAATQPLAGLPALMTGLAFRSIAYGPAESDPRAAEITAAFGLPRAATCLIALIAGSRELRLVLYADNGAATELYEDLHDVEMLLKEAETALGLLEGG